MALSDFMRQFLQGQSDPQPPQAPPPSEQAVDNPYQMAQEINNAGEHINQGNIHPSIKQMLLKSLAGAARGFLLGPQGVENEMNRRERGKQFGVQQDLENRRLQAQQDEAQAKIDAQMAINGMGRVLSGGATQQGGQGLNDQTPQIGEQPGQTGTPRLPSDSQGIDMSAIMPLVSMFGQQQASGLSMNAPGQQAGGMPTPANRMSPTGGASGGGGVASPAAGSPLPTIFNIGKSQYQKMPGGDKDDIEIPMPPAFTAAGGPKTIKSSQLTPGLIQTIEKYYNPQGGAGEKLSEPELAIKSQLAAAGINKPLAQAAVENPGAYSTAVRLAAEAKDPTLAGRRQAQETEAAEKAHLSKVKQDNAASYWERVKESPEAWYGKDVDKDTRDFAEELARQRGEENFIPKRELSPQRKELGAYALDVKEMNGELRKVTAELIGRDPNAFGVLVGRWNEELKKLGAPVSQDPRVNYLVGRFKDLVNPMVARETKMAGGGRAAIQMMNMLKETLPALHDHPDYLKAAFDNTDFIANTSIKSNRHYNYGQDDMSQLVPGDTLKHKGGKTYHFKSYTPDGKIQTVEE